MEADLTLHVNGQPHALRVDPATPLLYVLRNQLALNGPKFGCGLQQCGACMVVLNGNLAWPSCQLPVAEVLHMTITTLEGLTRPDGSLHPLQQAFIDEQVPQCGYCLNGMVMSAAALLQQDPKPNEEEIRNSLYRVLCRCSVHSRAIKAIKRASEMS
ncbi:(2Fe-2S)-binding protein [Hymenobacter sp. GOD-10R]|uniref:(2Fe-2S)-binding protein n=1 Tax=Hymenobacter sp. GOD-10R TaxID=3093922 RepID=UPI002D76605A|nr:(2Fe-2S)-binding protein [Hymenobacter sp. GOD-10R]WRQ30872.1 (2Fe-2S)-binding protein [Hymenobacter sp. GOD-10R]